MDIGEPIAIAIAKELTEECPFDHSDGPHDKTNNLRNDASALGASLGSGGENFEVTIRPPGKDMKLPAGVAAHHLIPGNESLAKASKLLKLMKKGKEVKGDVGYDVNNKKNGVWLPGNYQWPTERFGAWSRVVATYDIGAFAQVAYAYACMDAKQCQFHDRHTDYSRWVKMTLEKIRLEVVRLQNECEKCDTSKKPYNPPYELVDILNNLSQRIKPKLQGRPKSWRMPFFTSRFALLYHLGHKPESFLP